MGDDGSSDGDSSDRSDGDTTGMFVCPHFPRGVDYEEAPVTMATKDIAETHEGWTCIYCIFATSEKLWDTVEEAASVADMAYHMGLGGHTGPPPSNGPRGDLPFEGTLVDHFMRGVDLYNARQATALLRNALNELEKVLMEHMRTCGARGVKRASPS